MVKFFYFLIISISYLYGGYSPTYGVSNILGISDNRSLYIIEINVSNPIVPNPIFSWRSLWEDFSFYYRLYEYNAKTLNQLFHQKIIK